MTNNETIRLKNRNGGANQSKPNAPTNPPKKNPMNSPKSENRVYQKWIDDQTELTIELIDGDPHGSGTTTGHISECKIKNVSAYSIHLDNGMFLMKNAIRLIRPNGGEQ